MLQAQPDVRTDSGSQLALSEDEIAAAAIAPPPEPDRRYAQADLGTAGGFAKRQDFLGAPAQACRCRSRSWGCVWPAA